MTKIIGLTGPTGAGKSVIAGVFADMGAKIIDCDRLARKATESPACISALCGAFGSDIVMNGVLNRQKLADRAFRSPASTARLNQITYPAILRELERRIMCYKESGAAAIVIDAPLLFEGGVERYCDVTVAVVAAPETRKKRIMNRDAITARQAELRMSVQKDNAYYAGLCTYAIDTGGSEPENKEKAARLYVRIMNEG